MSSKACAEALVEAKPFNFFRCFCICVMEIEAFLAHRAGLSSSNSQMEWMNVAIDLNRCRSIQRLHHLQNSEAPIGCSDMQAAFVWQHIWQVEWLFGATASTSPGIESCEAFELHRHNYTVPLVKQNHRNIRNADLCRDQKVLEACIFITLVAFRCSGNGHVWCNKLFGFFASLSGL